MIIVQIKVLLHDVNYRCEEDVQILKHFSLVPGALSLGVKRQGREANHSPPSSAEIKEGVEQ
jgi:hypothetical protein